jgi:hypothetical protein
MSPPQLCTDARQGKRRCFNQARRRNTTLYLFDGFNASAFSRERRELESMVRDGAMWNEKKKKELSLACPSDKNVRVAGHGRTQLGYMYHIYMVKCSRVLCLYPTKERRVLNPIYLMSCMIHICSISTLPLTGSYLSERMSTSDCNWTSSSSHLTTICSIFTKLFHRL